MESRNAGAPSKGVLKTVSESSEVFRNSILVLLQNAYLYEESQQCFKYKSAVLIKNTTLEEKYNAFRAKKIQTGYSESDLEETVGFLLFSNLDKAQALGQTGLLTGTSTCTILGDPSKGVYISKYSDCLDVNRWYYGKTAYIVIIKLTKGRVKEVLENYTQDVTAPTAGFDCHVSEHLTSVSQKSSGFHAYQRTQYFIYELLDNGRSETSQSPSAAYPLAIVSFSYMGTKAPLVAPPETSEKKKHTYDYLVWTGQIVIGTKSYDVGLKSTTVSLIPTKLPPVIKVDKAISMSVLKQLLPKAAFETCFSGEVCLAGLYCSLFELVPSEAEELGPLSQLLHEIKEKDLALPVPLNDGGFLILMHPSHFLTRDENASNTANVLQGLFIFPGSRIIERGAATGKSRTTISSEGLNVLPSLSNAEALIEKAPLKPTKDLCDVLARHMQSCPDLINPGLDLSPSREVGVSSEQYDVSDNLYSSPDWTDKAWQSFRSYLGKPGSFQLPVSKDSETVTAGRVEERRDIDEAMEDTCLSSSEETSAKPLCLVLGEQRTEQKPPIHDEKSLENCEHDNDNSGLTELMKSDNPLCPPSSDDLSAELIVSITSAERTLADGNLNVISSMSATKHDDFQIPGFSAAKLQTAGVDSLHDETVKTIDKDGPKAGKITQTKRKKVQNGKCLKKTNKACVGTLSSVKAPGEDGLENQKDDPAEESSDHSRFNSQSKTDWKGIKNQKGKVGKLNELADADEETSNPKLNSLERTLLMDLVCPLIKKIDRWDVKPVLSGCGRLLVPFGSLDFAQTQFLKKELLCSRLKVNAQKQLAINAQDNVTKERESSPAPETKADSTDAREGKDGENPFQNMASGIDSKDSLIRHPKNDSSKNDGVDTSTTKEYKKPCASEAAALFQRLRTVLFKQKRKNPSPLFEGKTSPKKCKVDSDAEALEASQDDQDIGVQEVVKSPPVDPLFAFALGLTPKEKRGLESEDLKSEMDSSEVQDQSISNKQTRILLRQSSKRGVRVKMLKKHQSIPAENVKSKWWLHFHNPSYPDDKDCNTDDSVRKTTNTCSSTDALTLLADLALGAGVEDRPQKGLETDPDTSCKESGLPTDVPRAEKKSLLHALLEQPIARPVETPETPSPTSQMEDGELVCLISKEHSYSVSSSSSLVLGSPDTAPQLSHLGGFTRLLHRQQSQNNEPSGLLRRKNFRYSHTFVFKGNSVQVTKQWSKNYDFTGDSIFATDPKTKAINRALHGPWDVSIQDNPGELRLIIYMWIGLFYSRSTPRFFQFDSKFKDFFSGDSDFLEMPSGAVLASARTVSKGKSPAAARRKKGAHDHLVSEVVALTKTDKNIQRSPNVIDKADDTTGKGLDVVSKGNVEPERVVESVHEGERVPCEENSEKEDRLEKDTFTAVVDTDSSLSGRSVSMKCDSPETIKDYSIKASRHGPLDEELPVVGHDSQLERVCDELAVSVEAPSETEPVPNESPIEKKSENDECLTEDSRGQFPRETELKINRTNEELDKLDSKIVTSVKDSVQALISHPQDKTDVQGQSGVPFNSGVVQPDLLGDVYRAPTVSKQEEDGCARKISLLDLIMPNPVSFLVRKCEDRCPTPTLDEVPSPCLPVPGSSPATTWINITPKYLDKGSTTPTGDEIKRNLTTAAPTSVPLGQKEEEGFKGISGQTVEQESSDLSIKSNQLPDADGLRTNVQEATVPHVDPSSQCQGDDMIPKPTPSMQSAEVAKSDGSQGVLKSESEDSPVQTAQEKPQMDLKESSVPLTSSACDKDKSTLGDALLVEPRTSITCTVFNSGETKPSFLEQVSQRCLQEDPTQASLEQECLIFSEHMKQLLRKRSKREVTGQHSAGEKSPSSCASPVTVDFSCLEEREDALDLSDAPSLPKFKVDMSDNKETVNPTQVDKSDTDEQKEPVDLSGVTAKCARLYEAMMDDVCAPREFPSGVKHFRMKRGGKNMEPSDLFGFCDQMKKEVDESFRSKLNSVVKNSCKTKYRFYILATSEDSLFEETKAQLESAGHSPIQPSQFLLGEGGSSPTLIILRNEDIAEHIWKVPRLLELKRSPEVQFAGIDDPDDVVNLTHQELFTRGGFVMFDRAAMESLTLCDMKKCSELLQELSREGKWKWMLHYRDSRQLKENARLCAEAKEKKCFLNSCQDRGTLKVLPYHECDHMTIDRPDYLGCLVHLQVQNISARYPVFITDSSTDSVYEGHGIVTMTVKSFLTKSSSAAFLFSAETDSS